MGLLTFSEMQSQVRSMLGGRTDQDALIMRGLQFAQHKITKVFHFEELFTRDSVTVSDTGSGNEATDATITMPATMRKLHSLALIQSSNTTKLDQVSADRWEKIIASTAVYERGEPSRYVLHGKTVTLWRVPSATYTIKRLYSVWPTEIVLNSAKDAPSTTTATSLLDHKDEIIITYAVVWCYLALGNNEKANYFFAIYKDMLGEAGTFDVGMPDLSIASSKPGYTMSDHTSPTFGGR